MTFSLSAAESSEDQVTGPSALIRSTAAGLDMETLAFSDFSVVEPLLEGLEGSGFQSSFWLSNWFGVLGSRPGIENFMIVIREAGGQVLLVLPMIRRSVRNIRVLEIPDLGVSDYAAPMVRRASVTRLPQGEAFWEWIKPALPSADLLNICRIAPVVSGMPNPLSGHPASRRNRLSGWVLTLSPSWTTYFSSLSRGMRDKLKKMGRKFDRVPGAERRLVATVPEALEAMSDLERLQSERIEQKGLDYCLDRPTMRCFYRRLIEQGLPSGHVQMTRFCVEGQTVAVNFSVLAGQELVYLRVANEFGPWSCYALGLGVTEFAISEAQKRGIRSFDFAMGNYDYKRRFGAVELPLHDLVLPLSWRGWPAAMAWHLRHWASHSPVLRRIFGKDRLNKSGCPRATASDEQD